MSTIPEFASTASASLVAVRAARRRERATARAGARLARGGVRRPRNRKGHLARRAGAALVLALGACAPGDAGPPRTPDAAAAFVDSAEAQLYRLGVQAGRAAWVQSNFITHDTEILAAEANERYIAAAVDLATRSARFNGLDLPFDVERKIGIIRSGLTAPAPNDPAKTAELARILTRLETP